MPQEGRDRRGRFEKGASGNPAGRPKGSVSAGRSLRSAAEALTGIVRDPGVDMSHRLEASAQLAELLTLAEAAGLRLADG